MLFTNQYKMIFLTVLHVPFNVNNMIRIRAIYVFLTYKDKNSLQSPDNRKRKIHQEKVFPLTFGYYSKFPLMPLSNLYLQKESILVSHARCSCQRRPIFLQKEEHCPLHCSKTMSFFDDKAGDFED